MRTLPGYIWLVSANLSTSVNDKAESKQAINDVTLERRLGKWSVFRHG